jgi:hypothetical protein
LNLQPHPGKEWAQTGGWARVPRRAVQHLLAVYDLSTGRLYGHLKARKARTEFLAVLGYVRLCTRLACRRSSATPTTTRYKGPKERANAP